MFFSTVFYLLPIFPRTCFLLIIRNCFKWKRKLSGKEQNRSPQTQELKKTTIKANPVTTLTVCQDTDQWNPQSFLCSVLSSPLCRCGNHVTEGLHCLPQSTGLSVGENGIWGWATKLQKTCYHATLMHKQKINVN